MDYREIEGVNQSSLKKILISPQEYLKAKEKQENKSDVIEPHFLFGSVVDIMLTGTIDEFDEKFVRIPDETKCSEAVKAIVDGVFNELENTNVPVTEEGLRPLILKYCNANNYQSNWKDDTRVDKIIKEGSDYFDLLKSIAGKTPITESEYAKAVNAMMALKADKYTRPYVVKKERKNAEFWDKFIVEFEFREVKIKGELDRVIVDHDTKEIIPIDFKTTGKSINQFINEFWYYRYDFQSAVYKYGLFFCSNVQKLLEQGYKLKPFLYIVVETNLINNPQVFEVSEKADTIGFSGGFVNNKQYEGFMQALNRYIYATNNERWDYPMEYYENNGKMLIEV